MVNAAFLDFSFTTDEQIVDWIMRSSGSYKMKQMPKIVEGMMDRNRKQRSFNFLKSMDIAAINRKTELLHPCTHEFWEQ